MISRQELKAILGYNETTGSFWWLAGRPGRKTACGWRDNGYLRIEIDGKAYRAHRLAWLYFYGEWPEFIDHINGDRSDNRIVNLRSTTRQINGQNQRAPSRNNSTGFLGVSKVCQRYRSQVRDPVNKTIFYLGTFDTPEQAHAAYVEKKRELHPGCTI